MKKFLLFFPSLLLLAISIPQLTIADPVVKLQYFIAGRDFSTPIWNTGVFNQKLNSTHQPGFQWPDNTGKFLALSGGLCIGAYYNGGLRISNASYNGEFSPGYVINATGVVLAKTTESYHVYKVSRGDNCSNNVDYCDWWRMVDKGAPYDDVNYNGSFDIGIDIPGVKNASQTVFVCFTDGFEDNHNISEGFSGGTAPLFAEIQFSSWTYDYPGYENINFMRYLIINKSLVEWKKTYFSMFVHPQIGDSLDDYVGCDTLRNLGYAYNRDNNDGTGSGNSYGAAPPAFGVKLLNNNYGYGMTSFHYTIPPQVEPCPPCEEFPYNPLEAYNLMRGFKKDNTLWLDATSQTPKPTKYTFPGDPETNTGWTEYQGVIGNCFGQTNGQVEPNNSVARTFLMSSGSDNNNLPCPSYIEFHYAQLYARGTNNKNSVTQLKLLSDKAQQLYNNHFVIGINPISTQIPAKYTLYQNYPNPFNPSTKIKFDVPFNDIVNLSVYDINGRFIKNLVNDKLQAGIYEVNFSAGNLPSGVYFYKFSSAKISEIKKMILVK